MKPEDVNEAMRLANLMALTRAQRVKAREKDPVTAAQAELRVVKSTEALRNYLLTFVKEPK